jgi:hypothetical protein
MYIYIAGGELFTLKLVEQLLLSYYDIYLSDLPFRKLTWNYILQQAVEAKRERENMAINNHTETL